MSRIHDIEKAIELFPIVREALDPDLSSAYLESILSNIQEYLEASQALVDKYSERLKAGNLTEEELDQYSREAAPLDGRACNIKEALHVLQGCHETMGVTPDELASLAQRYEVKAYRGLPSWHMVQEIQEKAFTARLRSDRALKRGPSVTDEQIKLVVGSVDGQDAQARTLGISVRQLQRRLLEIKKK